MSKKQAPPLAKHYLPLDKEVALRYVTWLVEKRIADGAESRRAFCEEGGYHPKLLYNNPHLGAIERLFQDQSSLERLGDMTLREYLAYQRHYLQQGERHGAAKLQSRWLGKDIAKTPWDCWVYQELFWETRPDYVIALGAMRDGAPHFYASILDLLEHGEVLGIDRTIARQKRGASSRIQYIEGASTSPEVLDEVRKRVSGKRVIVIADSGPDLNHVLAEIRAYAPFVHVGSYFIVEDTQGEVMGFDPVPGKGPKAAVEAFLAEEDDFVLDRRFGERYVMTLNPSGFLLRVK